MTRPVRRAAEILLLRQLTGFTSRLRVFLYRALGARIGRSCRLEQIRLRRALQIEIGSGNSLTRGCWLWPIDADYPGIRIKIGDGNYFNRDVMIDACGYVQIGDNNMFGPGVYITDSNHSISRDRPVVGGRMDSGTVVIGNGCWIGAKAVILKDVSLGDRCVVGAGAVVTRSFPADSVVVGIPARPKAQAGA